MSSAPAFISDDELAPALVYLQSHPEIREVLVSGGDPLTAPDSDLEALFTKLRGSQSRGSRQAAPSLRICTRVPVTAPERVTPELVELCRGFLRQPAEDAEDRLYRGPGLRFSVHINHPRELSPPTRQALDRLMRAGITVLVQTVLLRGVNDSAETLAALFDECHALGLTPYYLFQLDLAPGTAHFRVPLRQGLALYRDLQNSHLVTNSHLPVYAVDLPGGGGKIRLGGESIAGEEQRPEGRVYLLRAPDGGLWPYPA
jgi:lysine 2,3-aminomutase